jgi:hypothetical protein
VLATSREKPHVKKETVMVIGGLSLMEDSQPAAYLVSWEPFGQLRRLVICDTVSEPGTHSMRCLSDRPSPAPDIGRIARHPVSHPQHNRAIAKDKGVGLFFHGPTGRVIEGDACFFAAIPNQLQRFIRCFGFNLIVVGSEVKSITSSKAAVGSAISVAVATGSIHGAAGSDSISNVPQALRTKTKTVKLRI